MTYQICNTCIMDTTASEITFDSNGQCSFCKEAASLLAKNTARQQAANQLEIRVSEIKERNKNKPYDAIIGLSGGVDSAYAAHIAHKQGLRLLAVHCDTGWNSDEAVSNIHSVINKLKIDLETYVVPWETMRDLQAAFFRASVPNCDIPQDHAIVAVNNIISDKVGVRDFISGGNLTSEAILPPSWGHDARDLRHLKAVGKKFGVNKLGQFPTLNGFQAYLWLPYVKGMRNYRILNDITYSREEAIETLSKEYNWKDYGGKHHESVFTRFFQAYYLPEKFHYDKRKAHLSSLIVAGQMTREEALEEMQKPLYTEMSFKRDKNYFLQKLKISNEEWDEIMLTSPISHSSYPTNTWWRQHLASLKNTIEQKGIVLRKSW